MCLRLMFMHNFIPFPFVLNEHLRWVQTIINTNDYGTLKQKQTMAGS